MPGLTIPICRNSKFIPMENNKMGRFYEDFVVGEKIMHAVSKTILESDNNLFCLLTMNHHPAHIDKHYAQNAKHGKILVAGTYVFSLVVGLTVADISGKAIANLEYTQVVHLAPVFIGDTVRAETEILGKKLTRSGKGIVHVSTKAWNQNGVNVLVFERKILVKKWITEVC